ncbi:MAG: ribulose-phosphate 3-epimerase [archaeon]
MIIPAIIAGSAEEALGRINAVRFAPLLQLDVMDGRFVPGHSLDFDFDLPDGTYEAHLMVKDPRHWVKRFINRVDTLLVHYESGGFRELRDYVRQKGKRIGLVINPETGIEQVQHFLEGIDQLLVMTVNPGAYGAKFLPGALDKVRRARQRFPDLDIEVDGGITPDTIGLAGAAGANMFVSGSYIIKSGDPREAIRRLSEAYEA